jgi:hypothetical protein
MEVRLPMGPMIEKGKIVQWLQASVALLAFHFINWVHHFH